MTDPAPYRHPLRVNRLNPRQPTELTLAPDAAARAAIADELGLLGLPLLRMTARLTATAHDGWALTGRLTARVVQPCVVSLAPVETAIDEPVERRWSPHVTTPEGDEIEVSGDDVDPLGQVIDPGEVMVEALSLALPLYPRAPGAALDDSEADAAEPEPAARRPFAGLADLLKPGPARDADDSADDAPDELPPPPRRD